MTRLLIVSTLAIGLSVPSLVADAANLRHEPRHNLQARPTVQPPVPRPVGSPRLGGRQQVPPLGETWMDDGAIFGHPDPHG